MARPGGECYNASMPYRSGGGVKIADYVIRSGRIPEIGWKYIRVVYIEIRNQMKRAHSS